MDAAYLPVVSRIEQGRTERGIMEPEIRVEDLSKSYYPKQRKGIFKSETTEVEALKSVSLEIHEGEIFGLPARFS
jgi:ABC-type glutathione transport system ATPase component